MKKFDKAEAKRIVESIYEINSVDLETYQDNKCKITNKLVEVFGDNDEVSDFIDFEFSKIVAIMHISSILPDGPDRDKAIQKISNI